MGALSLLIAAQLRDRLDGPYQIQGPFLGRDLRVNSDKIRLSGTTVSGMAGLTPGSIGALAPRSSYQWLFFETIDGAVPAGAQDFAFEGPPIPFVGAITEVDVIATDPTNDWQMRVSLDGYGTIFKTSQSALILEGDGFFRPTPPGFWPETEGLTVPIDQSGRIPRIEVRRNSDTAPSLTLRVLIVAHPAF